MKLRRGYLFISWIFLMISIVVIWNFWVGVVKVNTWQPDNTYTTVSDPILKDIPKDIWVQKLDETIKPLGDTNYCNEIDIWEISHQDTSPLGSFYLVFWNQSIPWNDTHYGFAVYIYPDSLKFTKDPGDNWTAFILLCKNGNITFFDNSTIREYWNGTDWDIEPYNLTPSYLSGQLIFSTIPYACYLKYTSFSGFSIALHSKIKAVFYFKPNATFSFYDWIPGEDRDKYVEIYPLINIVLFAILFTFPLVILIDFVLRKLSKYADYSKRSSRRLIKSKRKNINVRKKN